MQNLCIQYRKWMCEFGPRSILLIITSGYVTPNKEQWQMIKVKKKTKHNRRRHKILQCVTESRVTEKISNIDWIHGMVCVNKVMSFNTQWKECLKGDALYSYHLKCQRLYIFLCIYSLMRSLCSLFPKQAQS